MKVFLVIFLITGPEPTLTYVAEQESPTMSACMLDAGLLNLEMKETSRVAVCVPHFGEEGTEI